MQLLRDLVEKHIKSWEQCVLHAYQDCSPKKNWTIGWGHTGEIDLPDLQAASVVPGLIITQEQADALFDKDLTKFTSEVLQALEVTLNNYQFSALVILVYNIGVGNFKTSTLLRLLHEGKILEAAAEFPKWDHCDGVEVAGLLNRRRDEQKIFLTGLVPTKLIG